MDARGFYWKWRQLAYVLFALLVVSQYDIAWAQGEGLDCTEEVAFVDTGCTSYEGCPPSTAVSCTSADFTPSCSGDYTLDAWTVCNETSPGHCQCCVVVRDGANILRACKTDGCPTDYDKTCGTVRLSQGHTYQVTVCLTQCPMSDADCTTCGNPQYACKAWACLRIGETAPCYP
jgi:hypothetical protein